LKIISWNVNGIRACIKKGFKSFVKNNDADIICLQEVKADNLVFEEIFKAIEGYSVHCFCPKKGYSGTLVLTKHKPHNVEHKIGFTKFDNEGRLLKLDYNNFSLINIYVPNGGRKKESLSYKLEFFKLFFSYLKKQNTNLIITGDINIAHTKNDLARPQQNKNNTMFTPKERKQIDKLVDMGYVDTFRKINKQGGNYSWWVYYANARERNLGWRIDYIFTSKKLGGKIRNASIQDKVFGSDHCPVIADIGIVPE